MGMSDQVGNELDEFVTDTLRNNLLGLPLDLAAINMPAAATTGIPSLNILRRQLFATTNDASLKPYASWVDFGQNLKHPESLVNFVAAYGTAPDASPERDDHRGQAGRGPGASSTEPGPAPDTPADAADFMNSTGDWANDGGRSTTGLDNVDLWVGGLAERRTSSAACSARTFNYVFEHQLTDLQDGDRLYYLSRTPGLNLRTQLEGNSFAELIMRNTDAPTPQGRRRSARRTASSSWATSTARSPHPATTSPMTRPRSATRPRC